MVNPLTMSYAPKTFWHGHAGGPKGPQGSRSPDTIPLKRQPETLPAAAGRVLAFTGIRYFRPKFQYCTPKINNMMIII